MIDTSVEVFLSFAGLRVSEVDQQAARTRRLAPRRLH